LRAIVDAGCLPAEFYAVCANSQALQLFSSVVPARHSDILFSAVVLTVKYMNAAWCSIVNQQNPKILLLSLQQKVQTYGAAWKTFAVDRAFSSAAALDFSKPFAPASFAVLSFACP
jgi:hypothetical protein